MKAPRLLSALGAALALSVLVVAPPVLLVIGVGNPLPDWPGVRAGQLDAPMLIHILACIVWIAWAQFTLGTVVEAVAAAARRPVPRRVAIGQGLARALVTIIATAIATAPLTSLVPTAHAAPNAADHLYASRPTTATPTPVSTPSPHAPVYIVGSEPDLPPSLWAIAERHLGNPLRWKEIWQLNRDSAQPDGRVFDDPNLIRLGWELRLPADAVGVPASAAAAGDVTVAPGDTLSGIAQRSGLRDWQPVWDANAGRAEPGGERFVDPDLIKPGWTIAIPESTSDIPAPVQSNGHAHPPAPPPRTAPVPPPPVAPPRTAPVPPRAEPSDPPPSDPPPSATPTASVAQAEPTQAPAQPVASSSSRLGYAGLLAGGGLLAACAAAALAAHRRRQLARRRPGRMIAPPTPELVGVEKAIAVAGRPALAGVEFLDLALRDLAARLAAAGKGLPDVVAAGLHEGHLELVLAQAASTPPEPWNATSDRRWAVPRSADLDAAHVDRLAPYPCLVSVGYTTHGTEWLLDLEHARVLQLTGDPERALALARFMVAELGLNRWSDDLTTTLAGFGDELVSADPSRLRHTDDLAAGAEHLIRTDGELTELADARGADVLCGRLHGARGDAWMPELLFANGDAIDDEAATALTGLIKQIGGRRRQSSVTVVLVGSPDAGGDWTITVTADGRLDVPDLQVDGLLAHGLTDVEAHDVAAAIALASDTSPDVVVPVSDGDRPCDAVMDLAGALLPGLTVERVDDVVLTDGPTEIASSVLSCAATTYVSVSATTIDEVEALAPAVEPQARRVVEEATSGLDRDVAEWHNPDSARAKLQILGPVRLTARGQPPKSGWGGICTEAIAYLALHPRGASADQFAADMWPDREYDRTSRYVQNIASAARKWLGTNPLTGGEYMPWLSKADVDSYGVDGVLVDAELFRQLRARGTARGADGLSDLVAALELVSGRPFDRLRPAGYSWLEPGEDTLYEGMIDDVAHLVATHALADDNAEQARWAAEIVLAIDSCNERALCNLATSYMIDGKGPELDATVKRLCDLDDLTDRTCDFMRRNGWPASR
jgi:DNA-binding SARP family transcriptional activator